MLNLVQLMTKANMSQSDRPKYLGDIFIWITASRGSESDRWQLLPG